MDNSHTTCIGLSKPITGVLTKVMLAFMFFLSKWTPSILSITRLSKVKSIRLLMEYLLSQKMEQLVFSAYSDTS
jgi:hypothetical protein